MTKSSKDQMKQDEKKVLFELMKNAKENTETIAKNCKFSRQKTWRIIKHLEVKKLVWGYTTIFDQNKIGLNHFMVMIKKSPKPLKNGEVNQILTRRAEDLAEKMGIIFESSFYVHGEYDWVFTFNAGNIKQAKKFSDTLAAWHAGEIEKITMIQTLLFVRNHYILNPEKEKLKDLI